MHPCREFAEETMGLFGGCEVNGASVAACSRQMHTQLIQRQHVLKVVHQLKKVLFTSKTACLCICQSYAVCSHGAVSVSCVLH